jgi:hypothetical protein
MWQGTWHAVCRTQVCFARWTSEWEGVIVLPMPSVGRGHPRTCQLPVLEEVVLGMVVQHPHSNTHASAGVNHHPVYLFLYIHDLYQYTYTHRFKVSHLVIIVLVPSEWHLCSVWEHGNGSDMLNIILWMDEAAFTNDGVIHSYNHCWHA